MSAIRRPVLPRVTSGGLIFRDAFFGQAEQKTLQDKSFGRSERCGGYANPSPLPAGPRAIGTDGRKRGLDGCVLGTAPEKLLSGFEK